MTGNVDKLLRITNQTVPLPARLDKETQGFLFLLEQGQIPQAIDYRIEQLRQKIKEDRVTSELPKATGAVSLGVTLLGGLLAQNPIFWVLMGLSATGYGASILLQFLHGREIKPLPFFKGSLFDLQIKQHNQTGARTFSTGGSADFPPEMVQAANYLDELEKMEYLILRCNQKLAEQVFSACKNGSTRFAVWRIVCRKLSDGTFTEYFNDSFSHQGGIAVLKPAKLRANLQRIEAQLGEPEKHSVLPAISRDQGMASLFLRPADDIVEFPEHQGGVFIMGDDGGQPTDDVTQYLAPELQPDPQVHPVPNGRPQPVNPGNGAIAPDAVDPADFGIPAEYQTQANVVPPTVPGVPPGRPIPNNRPGVDTQLGAIDVEHTDITGPQAQDTNERPQPAGRMPRVDARQLGGKHGDALACANGTDPASTLARFDQDGNIRNLFICGKPGAGKGTLIAAIMMAMTRLFPMVEFWVIDPKNDPNELHRWANIPEDRRLHFEAGDPALQFDSGTLETDIQDFLQRFYESPTRPKILIVDELPAIVTVVSKKYAEVLRGFISNTASMGRSRQYAVWVSTQAVGVGENGLTTTSKTTFSELYLVNFESAPQITGHPCFKWPTNIPSILLKDRGRALFSTINMKWIGVPALYKEMVDGKGKTVPVTAEGEAQPLPARDQMMLNALSQNVKHSDHERTAKYESWGELAKTAFDGHELEAQAIIVIDVIVDHADDITRKELLAKNKIKEQITKRTTTVSKIVRFLINEGLASLADGSDPVLSVCLE